MKKIIPLLLLFFLISNCAKPIKAVKISRISYSENSNTSFIKNIFEIDIIKIKGKWEEIRAKNPKLSHSITITDNEVMLDFSPYSKERRTSNNKILSDKQLLNLYLEDKKKIWDYLYLRYSILKSDNISYYIVKVNKKISLIGIKGDNSYYLTYIRKQNKDFEKEANYLIDFFQNKIISENQK